MSRVPSRSTSPASPDRRLGATPIARASGPPLEPPPSGARQLAAILRRRWFLVVFCTVAATVAAYFISDAQTRKYRAEATLLVVTSPQDLAAVPTNGSAAPTAVFDEAKGRGLASLDVVARRTSAALHNTVPASQIQGAVSIEGASGASLVKIIATDPDPQRAARIATAFSRTYIAFLKEADQTAYQEAAALVQQRLDNLSAAGQETTESKDLRDQLQRLKDLAALQTGGLRLVQPAQTPSAPFAPRVSRMTAVGFIGGLVFGLALALGIDALDRRVRDSDEFSQIYQEPILGLIPRSKGIGAQGANALELEASDLEAFRILRANLRYVQGAKGAKRIIVSSSTAGEGKSTVAWNLALVAAKGGSRVLLIEADLRQPQITRRYLPRVTSTGLSQVLSGQASVGQALVDVSDRLDASGTDEEFGHLSVLLAGGTPPNPAELLASQEMVDLLDNLDHRFDLVILDAPPPALVADAIPLSELVDGVLVVGRIDVSDRRGLADHRDRLDSFGARVLGLVVNGVRADAKSDYY